MNAGRLKIALLCLVFLALCQAALHAILANWFRFAGVVNLLVLLVVMLASAHSQTSLVASSAAVVVASVVLLLFAPLAFRMRVYFSPLGC